MALVKATTGAKDISLTGDVLLTLKKGLYGSKAEMSRRALLLFLALTRQ